MFSIFARFVAWLWPKPKKQPEVARALALLPPPTRRDPVEIAPLIRFAKSDQIDRTLWCLRYLDFCETTGRRPNQAECEAYVESYLKGMWVV